MADVTAVLTPNEQILWRTRTGRNFQTRLHTIRCVDRFGNLLWDYSDLDKKFCASPAVDGNKTIYVHGVSFLTALSMQGKRKWQMQLSLQEDGLYPPVIDSTGTVLLARGNKLYFIGTGGYLRWILTLAEEINSPVILSENGTILVSAGGSLLAIGSREGISIPVPIISADRTEVTEGIRVSLDGSNSYDADGDHINFLWEQTSGPPVILAGENKSTASFLAPTVPSDRVLIFKLTVKDGRSSDSANVAISVRVPSLVFPWVASAEKSIDLSMLLTNTGPDEFRGEVNFFDMNGAPHPFDISGKLLERAVAIIPANGTKRVLVSATGAYAEGFATLEKKSKGNPRINGMVTCREYALQSTYNGILQETSSIYLLTLKFPQQLVSI
jgi:hypothetical protein